MTDQRKPPQAEKYGTGTQTRGRFSPEPPVEPGAVAGNPEPPFTTVGPNAISPLLEHVPFPATRAQIVERIGDMQVPVTKDRTRSVAEILEEVVPDRFQSTADVERAVAQLWDRIAEREGRGGRHGDDGFLEERPRNDSHD